MTDKIIVKKVVVGTPIKKVTAGAFSISNLAGVDVSATESDGSILAYNKSTSKWEVTNLRSNANISVDFDSEQNKYTFGLTNNAFIGSIVPDSNEVYDLGSSTKKWRDLYLSGNTITLGTLSLKDSGGDLVVVDSANKKINLDLSLSTNNTAVFTFDSSTGTFTFNDSDLARTNINETFHSGLTVNGGLSVAGGATLDSATITNLANTNLTGSQATLDSANIGTLRVTGNTVLDGNLTITGTETTVNTETINLADNTIVLNSNATGTPTEDGGIEVERGDQPNKSFLWDEGNEYWTLGSETLQTTGKILYGNVYSSEGDLPNAGTYHGMFAHVHGTGKGYFAHGGAWHKLLDETSSTTASLTEGSNLYYTRARFDSALGDATSTATLRGYVSGDKGLVYNSSTGVFNVDSANIRGMFSAGGDLTYNSGTGQFTFDVEQVYTKSNFDSDLGDANTGQLPEGSNLYYTTTRFDDRLATKTTANIAEGSNLYYTTTRSDSDFDVRLGTKSTTNVSEGSNLYYTTARADSDAKNSVSVTDAGGDGSLSYNSTTGVITYTGPSAAEVRAHLSAGGDLTYNSSTGVFSIDVEDVYTKINFDSDFLSRLTTQIDSAGITTLTTSNATITTLASTQLNGGQATFDSATITNIRFDNVDAQTTTTIRGLFSAAGDLTYNSSTGAFSIDVEDVYTKSNFDSDLGAAVVGGTGVTYDSASDTINLTNTGVSAGTFGSATQVPQFSVNAQGQIDSAKNITIAGVTGVDFDSSNGTITIQTTGGNFTDVISLDPFTTANLSENTNLYYTDARARASNSVTDAGGDGSLAYNSTTGVITYTGPSAAEVRAHLTANKGLSVSNGEFNIDSSNVKGMFSASDAGGDGSFSYSNGVFTYTGPSASEVRSHLTANKGLSVSNGEFNIDSANVKAMFSGSSGVNYSNGAITADTNEIRGFFTANKGLSVSSGEFNIDSANVRGMFSGGTGVTYNSGTGAFAIGQAVATSDDVTFQDVTVSGNLTITGDTVQTGSVVSDNNFTGLTNSNTGNSTDFGFYGKYVEGSTTKYGGIFYDASTDNTFRLFSDTQTVPTSTVNTGASGYTAADLIVKDITAEDLVLSGNLTVNGATVTNSATNTTIEDALIELGSGNTGSNSNDLGLVLERGTTGDNVFIGWDESIDRVRFATTTATGASTGDLTLTNANVQAANFYGNLTGNVTGTTSDISNHTTADLTENTNLYHTTARARGAISVTDAGGDGSASYNSSTGVITYTGPSASEVRAHLTANKGLSVSSGEFNIDSANVRGMFSASGDLSYNSGTGQFSFSDSAQHTSAQIRAMFSGSTGITLNGTTGAISTTDGDIVHDNLSGFVADEHIDHSGVTLTAGTGLTGGGTIEASRTFNVIGGKGIIANANDIQVDSANIKGMFSGGTGITFNDGAISTTDGDIVHDNLSGFVANEHIDHSGVTMTAGTGLTGGGTIAATRTFNVIGGKGITANANDIQIDSANVRGMFSASGDLSYNSGTGAFSYSKQTSAQLLTSIKTVDGASSGLDADLLDGQHGAHYRINVYNNSGTLLN